MTNTLLTKAHPALASAVLCYVVMYLKMTVTQVLCNTCVLAPEVLIVDYYG